MKTLIAIVGIGLGLSLTGCAMTPEQREATEKAWAERDRERAAECKDKDMLYMSGSCVPRGSIPSMR